MIKTELTKSKLQHLCDLYNKSYVSALEYILFENLCDDKERREATNLLYEQMMERGLRDNIDNKDFTKRMEKFFSQFGLKFDYGHAYYKITKYTVIREYYKSVEIEAISPQEALNKAKATYAFDEVSSIDPIRTYVEGTEIED